MCFGHVFLTVTQTITNRGASVQRNAQGVELGMWFTSAQQPGAYTLYTSPSHSLFISASCTAFNFRFNIPDLTMSAQQIKLKLKEARDAIGSGDMKAAIMACKVGR